MPSGILFGSLQDPGHFDECVKFRHNNIQGQHCMLTVEARDGEDPPTFSRFDWRHIGEILRENKLTLRQGICLPAVCSREKVINYSNEIFNQVHLDVINAVCRTNDPVKVEAVDVFAL